MTKTARTFCLALLTASNFTATLAAPSLAFAEPSEADRHSQADRQSEEYLARGGVIVTVGTATLVAGTLASGFRQIGEPRTQGRRTNFGPVTSADSALTQRLLAGTLPGDVIRIQFMAISPQALATATEDMEKVATVWAEQVKSLEAQEQTLLRRLTSDGTRDLSIAERRRVVHSIQNDLSDVDSQLKLTHGIAGQARAQYMTMKAAIATSSTRPGAFRPMSVVMNLPVQYNMPISVDTTLSRIFAQDNRLKTGSSASNVRILRLEVKNTNYAVGALKAARRGTVGFLAGLAIIIEEITVGAIGEKLTESANKRFKPEIRTEPAGQNP